MDNKHLIPIETLRKLMDVDFVEKRKMDAIKLVQEMTGLVRKDAKNFIEEEWIPFVIGEEGYISSQISNSNSSELKNLEEKVNYLINEVEDLRSIQTKTRAKGIFDADD